MKLYLATTTLNIDNILSTESIAPYSFYEKRDYGYTSYFKIDLVPCNNILLLFSKIPNFKVDDRECESYPMVLEIDIENTTHLKPIYSNYECEVFSCDEILRITPYNCKVLFFTQQALNMAKLSCSDSLTNKLGDKFTFQQCSSDFDLPKLLSEKITIDDICQSMEEKVIKDNRLNKVKGFIFGYYLGVSKSVSPNSAKLLKIQKRIYDIVSTIKNNGGSSTVHFQEELNSLDAEYRNKFTERCRTEWNQYLTSLNIPPEAFGGIDAMLKTFDENSVVKLNFMKKHGLPTPISLKHYGMDVETYRNAINKHTEEIINADHKKCLEKFAVKDTFDLDPSYETCMLAGFDKESDLFNKFIDFILWHGSTPSPETLRTDRFHIATEITKQTKSIWNEMHDEWENSFARSYLNNLRQNIQNFTAFKLNDGSSTVLQSIAAFVLKGEDYDAIVQLLEDSLICDYRYSLALWGACTGYVKIPRPIISPIVIQASFNDIYKEIIYLLHKLKSEGNIPTSSGTPASSVNESSSNEPPVSNDITSWSNKIINYLKQMKNVQKKESLINSLNKAIKNYGETMDYQRLFTALKGLDEWKTQAGEPIKALRNLIEYFCPKTVGEKVPFQSAEQKKETISLPIYNKETDSKQLSIDSEWKKPQTNQKEKRDRAISSDGSNLKPLNPSDPLFVRDINACNFIFTLKYIPQDIRKTLSEKIKTFQKGYALGGQYEKKNIDNKSTTQHFKNSCFYKRPYYPPVVEDTDENKKIFEQLINDLLKRYEN